MCKRIGLVRCINPNHEDKTPSMAVYESDNDKLSVFCFGCKYHARIDPIDVDITQPKQQATHVQHEEINMGYDYAKSKRLMCDYCNKRNLSSEKAERFVYSCSSGFDGRPYMSWSIYDYIGKYIGWQRRYLDDAHPKTKYNSGIEINNKHKLYYTSLNENDNIFTNKEYDIVITESAFDSFWVKQQGMFDGEVHYYTTLGTPDSINWEYNVRTRMLNATNVYLFFDRDIPGYKTTQAILTWWEFNTTNIKPIDMMEDMPEGSAVYDYKTY